MEGCFFSLLDATNFAGALEDGLVGESEDLGVAALAHGARLDGVGFERGDMVFDATGQELGECMGFCRQDKRLEAVVTVYVRTARFSDYLAIWRSTAEVELWPLEALEPAFAWYATGNDGKLMVIRD